MLTMECRYWAFKNQESMDGLPGLKRGVQNAKTDKVAPIKKMEGSFAPKAPRTTSRGVPTELVLLIALLSFLLGLAVALCGPSIVQNWDNRRTLITQVRNRVVGGLVMPSGH